MAIAAFVIGFFVIVLVMATLGAVLVARFALGTTIATIIPARRMFVAALGGPVAHFATRQLDRLTQFDPHVFE